MCTCAMNSCAAGFCASKSYVALAPTHQSSFAPHSLRIDPSSLRAKCWIKIEKLENFLKNKMEEGVEG